MPTSISWQGAAPVEREPLPDLGRFRGKHELRPGSGAVWRSAAGVTGGSVRRRALITGVSGQDGSFLAEILLRGGYEVTGLVRGGAHASLGRAEHMRSSLGVVAGDLLEPARIAAIVAELRPDELYHLAAPSFVPDSWRAPDQSIAEITVATAAVLRAARDHSPDTRIFFASSSAMYGSTSECPQDESTPCEPQSPYATAKLAAHQLVGELRERDGIFACSGILFNHESERRPKSFVTRKITHAAAAIKLGLQDELVLGELDAVRDWSFAGDIMRGAWMMLQLDEPTDCVLASGEPHSVADFARLAFAHVGLDAENYVRVDPGLVRTSDPKSLVGNPHRARELLGWRPTLDFEQLVRRMVDADLEALRGE